MDDVGEGPGLLMKISSSAGLAVSRTRRMVSSASVPVMVVTPLMAWAVENSEVSPAELVAVAARTPEAAIGIVSENVALPAPSVVSVVEVRKVRPSPKPVGSALGLAKNSRSNEELAVLFKEPLMVVLMPSVETLLISGKFWSELGPESASPVSFAVTPAGPRSMPRPVGMPERVGPVLEKMELRRNELPSAEPVVIAI